MIKIKEETIGMNTSVERLVKEGDEVSNVPCHYFSGIYYLKDKAHLELMQPDIATIEFVSNGRLYTEYYDFKSQKYSLNLIVKRPYNGQKKRLEQRLISRKQKL